MLQTATFTLVHPTAQYCTPVWCRRAHICRIDPAINDTLQIVTGCVHPTLADNIPVLADIQPAELRRNGAALFQARRAMEFRHLLHSVLTCPLSVDARRLKSKHPFVPVAQQLISSSDNNVRAVQWADHQWNAEWADNPIRLHIFIPDTFIQPHQSDPPKKSLGPAEPPPHRCQVFPLLLVQMGYGPICGL